MNRLRAFRLADLAEATGAVLDGDDVLVRSAAGLDEADETGIAFVRKGSPPEAARASRAGALCVPPDFELEGRALLRHANPRWVFAVALRMLAPEASVSPGVHPSAVVADDVELGEGVSIGAFSVISEGVRIGPGTIVGPQVFIGPHVTIGAACRLDPRAVVYRDCRLGDRVTLFAGAVIGCDGFGFEAHEGRIMRLEHIGNTVIGDDVEIGANSCVDRGTTGSTRVDAHAKLDNLVMIGHNCQIGAGTLIAGQTGIAGSTRVGRGVIIGGDCSLRDHVTIGDGATIGGRSAVGGDIPAGATVSGTPAKDHRDNLREMMALPRLPELLKEVRRLRSELDALRSPGDANA
ncbi:MAG: UDP-3-O-(3-hydroxymyristoyl)glucosamine N-acyltransferase [Planctomycetota bacterium]